MMPLEGIKVLDLGQAVYGPRVAVHLANMGASVIKIEHPAGGDLVRGMTHVRHHPIKRLHYMFEINNFGKKSLAIDARKEEGREIVYKLVANSDIFVSNLIVDSLRRLKMDYDTLSSINPKLIYGYASGWGSKGPDRELPAYDFVAFARSGLMATFGEPDTPPVACLPAFGDSIAAVTMAYGIMLALFHRERTGEGQLVDVSLFGSLIEAGSTNWAQVLDTRVEIPKMKREEWTNPLFNHYKCKDGKWIELGMLQTDLHWNDFCDATGLEELKDDPRFINHQTRCNNNKELIAILDKVFLSRTREEWVKRFRPRNIIWGRVQSYVDLLSDPQVWENEFAVSLPHPKFGEVQVPGIPVKLSKTPGEIKGLSPELGQNTEEILLELGYTWDDISRLKQQKVII